eukprot:MONOS_7012.1-p1 / transcript=MONOS_7012.1 / gene=MONOS_7012 / organism=Monocercomonoides_exilis_PA203 / gene_product=unspecified product / transcript_product=unspecified product / location=Mono_scaffold00231:19556-20693(-) / protein_length=353 / sequence_SO=supercontig / SO=protein_coding / is_pseudo=false
MIEMIADIQLGIFLQKDENIDMLYCDGIWQFCQHPNYLGLFIRHFGEAVVCLRWAIGTLWISFNNGSNLSENGSNFLVFYHAKIIFSIIIEFTLITGCFVAALFVVYFFTGTKSVEKRLFLKHVSNSDFHRWKCFTYSFVPTLTFYRLRKAEEKLERENRSSENNDSRRRKRQRNGKASKDKKEGAFKRIGKWKEAKLSRSKRRMGQMQESIASSVQEMGRVPESYIQPKQSSIYYPDNYTSSKFSFGMTASKSHLQPVDPLANSSFEEISAPLLFIKPEPVSFTLPFLEPLPLPQPEESESGKNLDTATSYAKYDLSARENDFGDGCSGNSKRPLPYGCSANLWMEEGSGIF